MECSSRHPDRAFLCFTEKRGEGPVSAFFGKLQGRACGVWAACLWVGCWQEGRAAGMREGGVHVGGVCVCVWMGCVRLGRVCVRCVSVG